MPAKTITCEFCNEPFSLAPGTPLTSDTACPRCGESVLDDDWSGEFPSTRSKSQRDLTLPLLLGTALCVALLATVGMAFVLMRPTNGELAKNSEISAETRSAADTDRQNLITNGTHESQLTGNESSSTQRAHIPTSQVSETPPVESQVDSTASTSTDEPAVLNGDPIYAFADGDDYRFSYEVTVEHETTTEVITGTSSYHVETRNVKPATVIVDEQEGSGTAFVVTSDGLLVTCAHVIDGATDIEVELGGKTYPAQVVDQDDTVDLALLRISADDLISLRLADSDAIQLGQDVRVIGYPLSQVLGTGIKATTGTISGIVQQDGQRQLQIDAAVNSGNSGGPVVNSSGEVVGIATARLTGVDISRIGFCVPANQARQLVATLGTALPDSTNSEELSGPQLVAAVSPAVAYVRVKSGPSPQVPYTSLTFNGNFRSTQRSSDGPTFPSFRSRLGDSGFGHGSLRLSHFGELIQTDDEVQLPYLLGPPTQLPLVSIPNDQRKTWTVRRETSLVQERRRTSQSGIPLPRIRRPFGPLNDSEIIKTQPALETIKYTITQSTDNELVIAEDYLFQTTQADEGQITRLIGKGTLTIDRIRGFTSAYEFTGSYQVESDQVTAKLPLTVKGHLLPREEKQPEVAAVAATAPTQVDRAVVNTMNTAPKLKYKVQQQISDMGWGVKSLAFHPNGQYLAARKADDYVEIYDVQSGRKVFTEGRLRDVGNISALTFSPDGKYLLAGGFKGIIKVWEMADNGLLTPVGDFLGHTQQVTTIVVSPDGEHVLSAGSDRLIRHWSLKTQREKLALSDFTNKTFGIHFIDANHAWISDGLTLRLVELEDGQSIKHFELRPSGTSNTVFFSPDAQTIAVTDGYAIKRWNTENGEPLPELQGKEVLWDAAFTPDGRTIICGGRGHFVFWNVQSQERDGHLLLGDSIMYVNPLCISADGKYLACYPSAAGQSLWIFDLTQPEKN